MNIHSAPCGPLDPRPTVPSKKLPEGVTPKILSSSGISEFSLRRRLSNIRMRRKSISGQSLIADATKASGEVMASQLREMTKTSRELE